MSQAYFSASGNQAAGTEEQGLADKLNLMVVASSGSPSWVVVYQGSPDGVNWTTIQTHDSSTNASGETVFAGAERYPCHHRRLVCVSCSGGQVFAFGWAT